MNIFDQGLSISHDFEDSGDDVRVSKITGKRLPTRVTPGKVRPLLISADFLSYDEASLLCVANGVAQKQQYNALRKKYPELPRKPDVHYGGEWDTWNRFFGIPEPYATLAECRDAALAIGIEGLADYKKRRFEDPRLPADPSIVYENFPKKFAEFIGKEIPPYETYAEASAAAVRLGFTSRDSYLRNRKRDPKLPVGPSWAYPNDWKGWADFLQIKIEFLITPEQRGFYSTYEEFKAAVARLGIRTQREYQLGYFRDSKLPSHPDNTYFEEWEGWKRAMAGRGIHYDTWQEARKAALQHRFCGSKDYHARYKVDDRLSSNPIKKYQDFPGFDVFLLPDVYDQLDDIRLASKILKIKSRDDYEEARTRFPVLPEAPDLLFADEWVSWPDACGLPTPYSYSELQELAQLHKCKTLDEYRKLWTKLKDPRMPWKPEDEYEEWVNVYEFLGNDLPAKLIYMPEECRLWRDDIQIHINSARSKGQRELWVCRFVRDYIMPNGLGKSVQDFLTGGRADIKSFKAFLDTYGETHHGRRAWFAINEYLEDALKRHFTEEDEKGYLYRVAGAANPLAGVEVEGGKAPPSESVKPVLAYFCVEEARKWIVPEDATSFRDLKNIQSFDGDYYPVNESVIDRDDPNCIYRKSGDQYYIWYPVHWMALYTLVSVPARGRQIMYNDSGEADEYIVELVSGAPTWVKNTRRLATLGRQQGFITHSAEGDWGMYFTSNKTSYDGVGYNVAWIPDRLVYWLTVLRDWQRKYNPVSRVTPWIDCATRCNLSKKKLAKKTPNVFLFRGWREDQPPIFAPSMTSRLAAALYFTQSNSVELATFESGGSKSALSRYSSIYTPHSMRVSLITAYVLDFGLPVSIIMKIAGHSSIVMSLYYTKVGSAKLRFEMAEAEKRALLRKTQDIQIMVEQQRLDDLQEQMVSNSEEALSAILSGQTGTQLVRDYGICPYAGSRCTDGGEKLTSSSWTPAPAGYIGIQNCPRCRHFVSGPVFMGGLAALWNEISLSANLLWEHYSTLENEQQQHRNRIQELDYLEAQMEASGGEFDELERLQCERANRKLHSEMEGVATKMDMYLCDMQAITKLIEDSKIALDRQAQSKGAVAHGGSVQLIASDRSELTVGYRETSLFQQLNEVCVNATIYQSASAVMATPRRSQIIDRMAMLNNIRPRMFELSESEQLVLGNQVTDFFFKRLNSRVLVDQLFSGELLLSELHGPDAISHEEFARVLASGGEGSERGIGHSAHSIETAESCFAG
ncbi:VPA1269 family protein [Pseudomonas simiae]|jgi:hypothetical protein|uniref:gamma-mobile-trio integrase GmtZ n=1 Tax=Pseudomonas simiae TaxID=321846 RepID=UPI000AECFEC7|nr:VPA1269 family protein [Pseudomonas simiae]